MEKRSAGSCDRCYKKKVRCCYQPLRISCTACERSGVSCSSLRYRPRSGRGPKPRVPGLHGNILVWEAIPKSRSSTCLRSPTKLSTSDLVDANKKRRHLEALTEVISKLTSIPETLRDVDVSVVLSFLQTEQLGAFYTMHELFVFGPSFAKHYQTSLSQIYARSATVLRDIFQAMITALAWARHNLATWEQIDVSRAAVSLQHLRTTSVLVVEDAVMITSLGSALAVFDVLTVCTTPIMILRYSLSKMKPWYSEISCQSCFDPIIISPIFWDTISCLVKRDIPVIKFQPQALHVIDQGAGFCTTLLPILYDLCVIATRAKESGRFVCKESIAQINQQLSVWSPPQTCIPSNISGEETAAMRSQAVMHRAAALIICHRLYHHMGTDDKVAESYADEILQELSKYFCSLKHHSLKHIVFPIFIALIEKPRASNQLWDKLMSPRPMLTCVRRLRAFVEFTRSERSRGFTGSLFDLFDAVPDLVVVP